ncbi:unnamed protein product [Gordionus sp. m RMFG-2023]
MNTIGKGKKYSTIFYLLFNLDFYIIIYTSVPSVTAQISCYKCDNRRDPTCADPLNMADLNKVERVKCSGCCVKWVQNQNSNSSTYIRACSDDLKIALIIKRGSCMKESNNQGHICFCEENLCNSSLKLDPRSNKLHVEAYATSAEREGAPPEFKIQGPQIMVREPIRFDCA